MFLKEVTENPLPNERMLKRESVAGKPNKIFAFCFYLSTYEWIAVLAYCLQNLKETAALSLFFFWQGSIRILALFCADWLIHQVQMIELTHLPIT